MRVEKCLILFTPAVHTLLTSRMDALVTGSFLVEK